MSGFSVPKPGTSGEWVTTSTAAKVLGVTPRGVRWLAREQRLPCNRTPSGQWLFWRLALIQILKERATSHMQSRQEFLATVRPQMLRVVEPRQARFRLVGRQRESERSLPEAEVKGARSFSKRVGVR